MFLTEKMVGKGVRHMEKDTLSTAVSEPGHPAQRFAAFHQGAGCMVYRHGPHRSPVSGPYAGTCLKRLRHFRAGSPYGMAYPSSGAGSDHHGWGRQGSGAGWADSGGPPGDTVWFPPYVKHWHGAAPGVAMTHISVAEEEGGNNVEWLEKVTEEQYTGN